MIQRPKNNPRNGDTVVPRVKRNSKHKSHGDGILLVDYLEKNATITAKYHVALLDKLKQQLVSNTSRQAKGILFLQDNAAPYKAAITHQ
jgi:hypothetical protein